MKPQSVPRCMSRKLENASCPSGALVQRIFRRRPSDGRNSLGSGLNTSDPDQASPPPPAPPAAASVAPPLAATATTTTTTTRCCRRWRHPHPRRARRYPPSHRCQCFPAPRTWRYRPPARPARSPTRARFSPVRPWPRIVRRALPRGQGAGAAPPAWSLPPCSTSRTFRRSSSGLNGLGRNGERSSTSVSASDTSVCPDMNSTGTA